MTPKSESEFSTILEERGITRSPLEVGIGSQLSFERHSARVVNIHFLEEESEEYLSGILHLLFSVEEDWLVFPRYGKPEDFLGSSDIQGAAAVYVSGDDVSGMASALVTLQQNLKVIGHDPYLIAGSGEILAAWDHHVISDGFSVQFANVAKATRFISRLNEFGAEFEVYYSNA